MHRRSLHRRRGECGAGFRQLVDENRFAFARPLLQDWPMGLGRVSELLGCAAPGVFTRALPRWSGTTPAAWRAQVAEKVPRRK